MGEKPDEMIREDIAQTRAEMAETLDAIQDKLSPQRIVDETKEAVREATVGRMKDMVSSASETAGNVAEQVQDTAQQAVEYVRENPMPAVLIGIGVTWLLLRARRSEPRGSYAPTRWREPGTGERGEYRTRKYREYRGTAAGESGYREGARQAREAAGDIGDRAQESWQYYSRRAETEFERWMRENPLTVGAAAVALGAAVGLSMPRTETEDEWLGETRDTLVDRAQEVAQDTVQQAQAVVDTAQETVQQASRAVGGDTATRAGGAGSR
jgi:ElaB/YqjD/DUF883 family membrane-anchored ribosome-binding protein